MCSSIDCTVFREQLDILTLYKAGYFVLNMLSYGYSSGLFST